MMVFPKAHHGDSHPLKGWYQWYPILSHHWKVFQYLVSTLEGLVTATKTTTRKTIGMTVKFVKHNDKNKNLLKNSGNDYDKQDLIMDSDLFWVFWLWLIDDQLTYGPFMFDHNYNA